MPTDNMKEAITRADIINVLLCYWFWAIGWIVMYLNQVRRGETFKVYVFIINAIIAWWVWFITYTITPEYLINFQIPIVSISWFLAHPILRVTEDKLLDLVIKKVIWSQK